jgi:hypothetical protein
VSAKTESARLSVLKLEIGDRIRLSAGPFEDLSKAFISDLQARFL